MFNNIISTIGNFYGTGNTISKIIGSIFSVCVSYKVVYFIIGLLFTRKFKKAKNNHKYGIVIAARNEEKVIGNLLDSINKQDYPKDMYQVFVVCDNCTDNTRKVAEAHGAKCYERHDQTKRTKGYALEYLFDQIEKDYKISSFEGYFVFDADNLLNKDYISKMNDAFDEGCKIITSYRNTKNFDENWVSSNYALHWLRSIRTNHRARSVLRLATNIQGTGFLFSNEIVKNGWHYVSLTEDRALTADAVAQGYQITYQDEAEFFDEQPVSLKVALRQRTRWSKGHLQAFVQTGPKLFINVIFGKLFLKEKWNNDTKEETKLGKFIESVRHRLASFDTLVQLTPISLINTIKWLLVSVLIYSCFCYSNGIDSAFFTGGNYLAKALKGIFGTKYIIGPGFKAMGLSIVITVLARLIYRVSVYVTNMWMAPYLLFIERKRIKKIKFKDMVIFTLTWPIFDIIGRYTSYVALFKRIEWKPIPHESKVTIDDVKKVTK